MVKYCLGRLAPIRVPMPAAGTMPQYRMVSEEVAELGMDYPYDDRARWNACLGVGFNEHIKGFTVLNHAHFFPGSFFYAVHSLFYILYFDGENPIALLQALVCGVLTLQLTIQPHHVRNAAITYPKTILQNQKNQ